ncbi:hypothetical protein BDV06DRAFT_213246 [Aspergillus oleicola]
MFMRLASPNERRTISREDLGFYNAVVIAAVYEAPEGVDIDLTSALSFVAPLRKCILEQPYLSVVVKDKHTDNASYEKVERIDLSNHISILHDQTSHVDTENKTIERNLVPILDRPWSNDIPPWRIVVLPLAPVPATVTATDDESKKKIKTSIKRCLTAFSFSHTLGDGVSGLIFHRAFLSAWNIYINKVDATSSGTSPAEQSPKSNNGSLIVAPSLHPLPSPFDTPSHLPISWKFLLSPLLAAVLPAFINNLFGLRASSSPRDKGTWTGARMFFDPAVRNSSRLRLLEIEAPLLLNALRVSRARGAKLTGVIHQLVVAALGRALMGKGLGLMNSDSEITNLVSGTAINMRSSIGTDQGAWGLFVSGDYAVHPVHSLITDAEVSKTETEKQNPLSSSDFILSEKAWASAREITTSLAEASVRLKDQAIGLLRYAPSIRSWTAKHVGGERDCSYRVSNLLAFDGEPEGEPESEPKSKIKNKTKIKISKVIFATPADVTGAPLAFDIVSLKGESLVCSVGWQGGALGLPGEKVDEVEGAFVDEILESIRGGFEALEV